uniref:Uncharacterized protein n=1 Tax=Anguilla anguilla TaxID=7936 RepID=A0A0E9WAU4_ANGAN
MHLTLAKILNYHNIDDIQIILQLHRKPICTS